MSKKTKQVPLNVRAAISRAAIRARYIHDPYSLPSERPVITLPKLKFLETENEQ